MCGDYGAENEEERKECDEKVSTKVHQYFREGFPRNEIIARICKELEYPETDLDEIRSWFEESNENYSNYMGNTYSLVSKTVEVFGKLKYGIAMQQNHHVFSFLNSRYGISGEISGASDGQIFLCDNYHGLKKPLNIFGEFISDTQLADFKLEVINSEYIVLIGNHHYTKSFYIHLCKIDLIQSTCTLVGSKRFEGRFECLVFDCKRKNHFGIYFRDHEYTKHYLYIADVKESQLVVQPTKIEIGQMLHKPLRLNGNKLQLFEHWFDSNDFKFIEYDLIPGQEKPEPKHLFTVQSEEDLTNQDVAYFWTYTKCYVLSFSYKTRKLVITIFDLEQQKLATTLRHVAYLYGGLDCICVDEKEQVLMIYADDGTYSFGVYRFPLNDEEMLSNKIFFKLRRDAMFYTIRRFESQMFTAEAIEQEKEVVTNLRYYFKQGYSRQRILAALYDEMHIDVGLEQIQMWFKEQSAHRMIPYKNYKLFTKTIEEHGRLKYAVALWSDMDKIAFINGRYGIHVRYSDIKSGYIFLLDNLHNLKKQLRITGSFPPKEQLFRFKIKITDSEHFLFIGKQFGKFCLHLCKIDYVDLTCTLLRSETVPGRFLNILLDYKHQQNFLILYSVKNAENNIVYYFFKTSVEDFKSNAPLKGVVSDDISFRTGRLDGDKIQMLNYIFDLDHLGLNYRHAKELECKEITISRGRAVSQKLFTVKVDDELNKYNELTNYWTGKNLYTLCFNSDTKSILISIFDINAQKTIAMIKHEFYCLNGIENFHVDEEDNLLMLYAMDLNKQYAVYRFPLNQPQKLSALTVLKLRRESMFYKQHKHPIKLPLHLQPFSICLTQGFQDSLQIV